MELFHQFLLFFRNTHQGSMSWIEIFGLKYIHRSVRQVREGVVKYFFLSIFSPQRPSVRSALVLSMCFLDSHFIYHVAPMGLKIGCEFLLFTTIISPLRGWFAAVVVLCISSFVVSSSPRSCIPPCLRNSVVFSPQRRSVRSDNAAQNTNLHASVVCIPPRSGFASLSKRLFENQTAKNLTNFNLSDLQPQFLCVKIHSPQRAPSPRRSRKVFFPQYFFTAASLFFLCISSFFLSSFPLSSFPPCLRGLYSSAQRLCALK